MQAAHLGAVSGLSWIVELTGLWTAWPVAACTSEQPQVFLFGHEPVAYDAQAPGVGTLEVRRARGFRSVVATGPIRPLVAVSDGERLALLDVPAEQVSGWGAKPVPERDHRPSPLARAGATMVTCSERSSPRS